MSYPIQPLDRYILQHIDEEPELLQELNRETHLKVLRPRMVSGHLQGILLQILCKMIRPKRILEIGTFTGYSAISMGLAIEPDALIHTIEINDELQPIIDSYIHRAGLENRIRLHLGSALDIVPTLHETFDLIFLDGDKREYPQYYHMAMLYLNSGGYILADNILWDGKVIEEVPTNDAYTRGIIEFNRMVKADPSVEKVILPLRDGLLLIRKK